MTARRAAGTAASSRFRNRTNAPRLTVLTHHAGSKIAIQLTAVTSAAKLASA